MAAEFQLRPTAAAKWCRRMAVTTTDIIGIVTVDVTIEIIVDRRLSSENP